MDQQRIDERLQLHPLATKTWEEYTAMAMLLGYRYSRTTNTFFEVGKDGAAYIYFDADTLLPDEVNTFEEREKRREEWKAKWRIAVIGQ